MSLMIHSITHLAYIYIPLYITDDSPYTFMKPVSILAPTTSSDAEKADLSKGAVAKGEAHDYEIPKSISENPYEI
jgi:hypothetical protein